MKLFEDAARVKGLWKDVFTPAEANHVYVQVFDSITKERLGAKGGLWQGLGDLSWLSLYNLLKGVEQKKKKDQEQADDNGSSNGSIMEAWGGHATNRLFLEPLPPPKQSNNQPQLH